MSASAAGAASPAALADPDKQALVATALSPLQQRALRLAEEDLG